MYSFKMPHSTAASEKDFVVPFYLDGKPKLTENTFDVVSPVTNEICWRSSSADDGDVAAALASAQQAYTTWRNTKPRERRDIFMRAGSLMMERYKKSFDTNHAETGASEAMFAFEYKTAAEMLLFTAGIVSTVQGSVPEVEGATAHAMVLREPYGVVLAIAPWNAPHILGIRACLAPLAAGNTVVLKGPELAPATYNNFVEILHEAGLPAGCLNTLFHRPGDAARITKMLIESPIVSKVNFCGSSGVGSVVAGLCGKHLKQCLMELGGKNPAIVCDDADLALAAKACTHGAFHNSGQICMSTERIIVFASVAEKFREQLKLAMEERSQTNPSALVLVNESAVKKNRVLLKDAVTKGATLLYGDIEDEKDEKPSKTRMAPVVVDRVTPEMNMYATESFGPTVSLLVVDNDEEAIKLANDTEYGLSSAVFTTNLARGFKFARQIVTGAVHINSPTVHDEPVLPHGGVKASGFGRFSGKECLDEWVRTKTVTWQEF